MTGRLEARVARVEQRRGGVDWRRWEGVPADQLPDEVLLAVILQDMGIASRYPPSVGMEDLTDEDLQALTRQVRGMVAEAMPLCGPWARAWPDLRRPVARGWRPNVIRRVWAVERVGGWR